LHTLPYQIKSSENFIKKRGGNLEKLNRIKRIIRTFYIEIKIESIE